MLKQSWYVLVLSVWWISLTPVLAQESSGGIVLTVQQQLQAESGQPPEPVQVVKALNRLVEKAYQDGQYEQGLSIAKQTLLYAEQTPGQDHPDTLASLHNLAKMNRVMGLYSNKDRNISCFLQCTQDPNGLFSKRADQQISQSR